MTFFLTCDFQFKKAPVKPIFYRDFKNINYEELECAIFAVVWNILYTMPSVDDQVLFLQNNISNLFNNHVPLKRLIINKDRLWLNANIKKSIFLNYQEIKLTLRFAKPKRITMKTNSNT